MKTAVVILNWNGKKLLEKFLPSVVQNSPEATIYLADNASTDDSLLFAKKHFPSVKIISNPTNGGYAKGYNDALHGLKEDIFVLLNNDVEVTENWLVPILECFATQTETAAIQPKILDYKKREHFEYAGAAGGFIDRLGYPFCRGRIFDTLEKDTGQYEDEATIFWASGACLAIRKSVFNEVGKLDESYFAHQEEIDLCWRIHNFGYWVKYIGKSRVYHLGGGTLSGNNPKKTFFNFRNSLFNLVKNNSDPFLWGILFLRLVLDGIAAIRFLLQAKPAHFFAIFQAHLGFWKSLPVLLKKRKTIPKKKIDCPRFSIVWQYFAKGKKNF